MQANGLGNDIHNNVSLPLQLPTPPPPMVPPHDSQYSSCVDHDQLSLSITIMSSEKDFKDQDNTKASSTLCHTWEGYTSSSTLHGVPYLHAPNHLDRVLWLVIVLVSLVCAVYGSIAAYYDWQNHPVITSLETTGKQRGN